MHSNLIQLATLVSFAAALPQGWEEWKPSTDNSISAIPTPSSLWSQTTPTSESNTISTSTSISSSTLTNSRHRWEAWNLTSTTTATSTTSTSVHGSWSPW